MSVTIDELWRRADFILRGKPIIRSHADGVINGKPCRIGWITNVNENYKQAFIMTARFGEECRSMLQNNSLINKLDEVNSGLQMKWGNVNPVMHDPGDFNTCVFTSRVYIFTDVLQRPRDFIREMFGHHNFEAVVIDDEMGNAVGGGQT